MRGGFVRRGISSLKHAIKFPTEEFALALGLAPQPVHGLAGTMPARPARRFARRDSPAFRPLLL